MKFAQLALFIEKIESTSSRLSITHLLAELFQKLSVDEFDKTIYLLQGRVAPLFDPVEFGMGEKNVTKAVALALHVERKFFETEYRKIGDLGMTVEHFKKQFSSFEEKSLSVVEVFKALDLLARKSGPGSQDAKSNLLAQLIRELDPLSCRFLVRIPIGALRLGFSDMTVLDAYSWMLTKDKSLRPVIEKAYHVRPDLGYIGAVLREKGEKGLHTIRPQIFTPILMMRAERLSSGAEIVAKLGMSAIESKYDGFRIQAHYRKTKNTAEVRLYSRNLEEVSFMYPDVVEGIKKQTKAKEVVFEGEAIGYDLKTGRPLPFQQTTQRKRKYDIEEKAKEIPLKFFVFELLYKDGKSYINEPFSQRRKVLVDSVHTTGKLAIDTVLVAKEKLSDDAQEIEQIFDTALSDGLEGIIAKKLNGVYQPGARASNWIKLKRSYSSKVDDTIDCLVMGYDAGKGKRTSFGIGAFLVGVLDEKQGRYKTIAKIGTGLTDIEWKELKKRSDKFKSTKQPSAYDVDKQMGVDVWVNPAIVVEIRADEISRSSVHTAGRTMKKTKSGNALEVDSPGYALRFPRLERFRDDKKADDATSLDELKKMYKAQKTT